jgi:hypothetical protein
MWPVKFEQRLISWNQLRTTSKNLPIEQALANINSWWFQTPWRAYHLHWDDRSTWPDPWELLSDNIYCDIARGLGILYTIAMLDRFDIESAIFADTDQGNLVLIDSGKYILNWGPELRLNNNLEQMKITNFVTKNEIKKQLY